jgi:hypothetical protein
MAIWKSARRRRRLTRSEAAGSSLIAGLRSAGLDPAASCLIPAACAYFFPGGCVNGELPTEIGGLAFSALGFRISLLLRA